MENMKFQLVLVLIALILAISTGLPTKSPTVKPNLSVFPALPKVNETLITATTSQNVVHINGVTVPLDTEEVMIADGEFVRHARARGGGRKGAQARRCRKGKQGADCRKRRKQNAAADSGKKSSTPPKPLVMG
ncbi:hypothetical protein CHUAL_013057 [Chamberlinius hualienensis]